MPNVAITNNTFASGIIANLGATFGSVGYLAQNVTAGSFTNSVLVGTGEAQFINIGGAAVSHSANTISLSGADARVTVTANGSVSNGSTTDHAAILIQGPGSTVSNQGDISGATGVEIQTTSGGGSGIINHGTISGTGTGVTGDATHPDWYGVGVLIDAGGLTSPTSQDAVFIVNTGTISGTPFNGSGGQYSIYMDSVRYISDGVWDTEFSNTAANITNSGTLMGSVHLLSQADRVQNSGLIHGDVRTGQGNDRVDNRGGLIHGTIDTGAGADTVIGGANDDFVSTGTDNDRVVAFDGDDEIFGGTGDDTLRGGGGDDEIFGGDGADQIHGGSSNDEIFGGGDADSIDGSSGNDSVFGGAGGDTVSGGSGHDRVEGGDNDDIIYGGTGDDLLRGNVGSDTLEGGSGSDTLSGGYDSDLLRGDSGSDWLFGGGGEDTLYGSTGHDYMNGGGNNDRLFGGAGEDHLIGSTGRDTLYGGQGADVFEFQSTNHSHHGSGRDTIADFEIGTDLIDLSGIMPGLTFVASYTNTAGEVRYDDTIGRLYIDTDGDGASDFSINLTGDPALTATDLIL